MRLYLAGPSGVGKSTVATMLSRRLAMSVREVEARQCWALPPGAIRQECFLHEFYAIISRGLDGVYTNHLLSVYGYSMALGLTEVAERTTRLMENDNVVVLLADKSLGERIARRRGREGDVLAGEVELHLEAGYHMLLYAVMHGIPVIHTDGLTPHEVVDRILDSVVFHDFDR